MEKRSALAVQEKIGEALLRFGAIDSRQIEVILQRQQCGDSRRFGEIAVALKYIGEKTLHTYLEVKDLPLWSRPLPVLKTPVSKKGLKDAL